MKLLGNNNVNIENYNGYNFITLNYNFFEVCFCDLGASIFYIKFHNELMTLTPSEKNEFLHSNIYHGKTIGRLVNRLKGNCLEIGNRIYKLKNNEGLNTLHGGLDGLSNRKFTYKIKRNFHKISIIFEYSENEKIGGLPGNFNILVIYELSKNGILIKYKATSSCLSVCSLTNHTFFTLGEQSIKTLELQIRSKKYIHPDSKNLLPLEIRDCNEIMDFSKLKSIYKNINDPYLQNSKTKGYDHYYYFEDVDRDISQIKLQSKEYILNVLTDYPGAQIYTDNYKNEEQFRQTNETMNRGIAIEPSEGYDKIHYLDNNQIYNHFIKLCFEKRNN